jgi:hypothetical protein
MANRYNIYKNDSSPKSHVKIGKVRHAFVEGMQESINPNKDVTEHHNNIVKEHLESANSTKCLNGEEIKLNIKPFNNYLGDNGLA